MYDILIVVNGELPPFSFWQNIEYQLLICTDGAAKTIKAFNLIPHIIIGDMDSIADDTSENLHVTYPNSKIHRIVDQNTTDFEKVLQYLEDQPHSRILCLGAFGFAADHSLHNLCLLAKYGKKHQLMLLHSFKNIHQWIFLLSSNTEIETSKGSLFSFFPLSDSQLSTYGLNWELSHQTLSLVGYHSVRNFNREARVIIECKGDCVCLITSKLAPQIYDALHSSGC